MTEEQREYFRKYYLDNKEKMDNRNRIYRENNKKRISENGKYNYKRKVLK